ncbi:YceI family protein [uncultured Sphingomonas sp.]|uniref:YceI family protein n=1 Tax=uncultured Sphingomonas sp. TaxID=158754 RepID=UPI0035C99F98
MRLAIPATLAVAVAAAIAAVPLVAQRAPMGGGMAPMMGAGAPTDVAAGTYAIEPGHTQLSFTVTHLGITPFTGMFSGASGSMKLDPAHPEATTLSVSVPIASVQTTSDKLTEELRSADWLDAARFPTATFVSSSVMPMGNGMARVDGTLTLHGVSRPASISARFFGAATNPMSKKASVGFVGRLMFKRAEFGVTKYVPMVSDDTSMSITAAFEKQ